MYKKKVVKVPLYFTQLVILLSDDIERIRKELPPMEEEEEVFAHCLYHHIKDKSAIFILLNPKHKYWEDRMHGIIAHEVLHASCFVFYKAGISPDVNNDEPQAYLVEWMTQEVYKVIDEAKS